MGKLTLENKKAEKIWIYPIGLRRPEKASSVRLLKGFISENPGDVQATRCKRCWDKVPELICINHADPRLRLYGCDTPKCRNVLIKFVIPEGNKVLVNSPKLRIIDFLMENPLFEFTKTEIIEALGMGRSTFYRYFPDLEERGIVQVRRQKGRAKLCKINLQHPLVTPFKEHEKKALLQIATTKKD